MTPPQSSFRVSLNSEELSDYIVKLLESHFPDGGAVREDINSSLNTALDRLNVSFTNTHRKYYNQDGIVEFSHLNSDHMCALIYLISNSIYEKAGDTRVATKLFYLNKILHAVDLFYSVKLPETFHLVHPVGSVIGHADYGNFFTIYQGCTVGADKGIYPTFGEGVVLYSGSSVLGDSNVGSSVVFAANSFIINSNIPSNSIVTGQFPNNSIKASNHEVSKEIFGP